MASCKLVASVTVVSPIEWVGQKSKLFATNIVHTQKVEKSRERIQVLWLSLSSCEWYSRIHLWFIDTSVCLSFSGNESAWRVRVRRLGFLQQPGLAITEPESNPRAFGEKGAPLLVPNQGNPKE